MIEGLVKEYIKNNVDLKGGFKSIMKEQIEAIALKEKISSSNVRLTFAIDANDDVVLFVSFTGNKKPAARIDIDVLMNNLIAKI